jgi:(2Fe-2S) ferredoxin
MSTSKSKFQRHFFVCQMTRPPGSKPSCGARGSADVYNGLQEGIGANEELWGTVTVSTAGCLGPCFEGPCIVVYPEGTWYAGVKKEDVPEIVEKHLVGGDAVKRLVYEWPSED